MGEDSCWPQQTGRRIIILRSLSSAAVQQRRSAADYQDFDRQKTMLASVFRFFQAKMKMMSILAYLLSLAIILATIVSASESNNKDAGFHQGVLDNEVHAAAGAGKGMYHSAVERLKFLPGSRHKPPVTYYQSGGGEQPGGGEQIGGGEQPGGGCDPATDSDCRQLTMLLRMLQSLNNRFHWASPGIGGQGASHVKRKGKQSSFYSGW